MFDTITRDALLRADALDHGVPVLIVDREHEATLGMVGILAVGTPARSCFVQYRYLSSLLLITELEV